VKANEVIFHELAYLEVATSVKQRTVTVELRDFVLANPDLVPETVRDKVTEWSDYVDYWAVDFTFGDSSSEAVGTQSATDGDTFHNQWQSYRTRAQRSLELRAQHAYDQRGTHTVLVKVVDVFGNDTTAAVQVTV
jgi:PAB1-binding protein PBP1